MTHLDPVETVTALILESEEASRNVRGRVLSSPHLEEDDGFVELVQGVNRGALNVGLLVLRVWAHQAVAVSALEFVCLLS